MRTAAIVLLLLSAALAAQLSLEFRDFETNTPIVDSAVSLTITEQSSGLSFDTTAATDSAGKSVIEVPNESLFIHAWVDDPNTNGVDYHATLKANPLQSPSETVFLEPVGTLRGIVMADGNAVPGAEVKFDCNAESTTGAADEFGAFNAMLPIGSCRVLAKYQDRTGYADVVVEHGGVVNATVTLSQNMANPILSHPLRFFAAAIALAIAEGAVIAYLWYSRRKAKAAAPAKGESVPAKKEEGELASIMRTLSDREKAVVQHLFDSNGESNQARMHNELKIPKTSLIRALQALEKKSIIQTDKDRKLIKVKLTSWIMLKK
jgi:uncharacterized membrane protein